MEGRDTTSEPSDSMEGYQEQDNTTVPDDTARQSATVRHDDRRQPFRVSRDVNAPVGNDDRTAAAALVQLQSSSNEATYKPNGATGAIDSNHTANHNDNMSNFYSHTRLFQSRSDAAAQRQSCSHTTDRSQSSASSGSSENQLQDTVIHLSNVVSCMQQQHALVSEKQEIMSNALSQITALLFDMRNGPRSQNVNHNNTVTELRGNTNVRQQIQDYSCYTESYNNRSYSATPHNRQLGNVVSHSQTNNFQERQIRHDANQIQQDERTQDRTLPNTTRERNYFDKRVSQNAFQNQSGHVVNNTQLEGWTQDSTLTNGTSGRNCQDSEVSQMQMQSDTFQGHHTQVIDNMQEEGWTENSALSNATRGRNFQSTWQVTQPTKPYLSDVKLPPFNGKEDWKVWITRFEAIARRYNWNDETKLDNLIPRLQGKAGDFVFNQLSYETMSSYTELVKELNSRFRTIETQKSYAAKFSQRVQKKDETAEEYATELKRLYSKAYKSRDNKTRQEDLVRRF